VAWFAGSVAIGLLYAVSVPVIVVLSIVLELSAIPIFLLVARRQREVDAP